MINDYLKRYDLLGMIRLMADILFTKLFFPKARIIRRPFYIRGKKYIRIGDGFTTGIGARIDAFPKDGKGICIDIGKDVQINDYVHIAGVRSVKIGNNVLIASKVFITDHNHGSYGQNGVHTDPAVPPAARELYSAPVVIKDNVWIGEMVSILPGVMIGEGAVIATAAVVNKDVPAYSIAAGVPAKVIKRYNKSSKKWEKA